MKTILITGGTTFISRYTAAYFMQKGYDVYVLNRGSKPQVEGVHHICGDRHALGDCLKGYHFDAVLDITAYDREDILDFVEALGGFERYIMISSSAVYPETDEQPFVEEAPLGENKFWGKYGTDKIAAEEALLSLVPEAYILRPPYLYGPMDNVYREAFVFDCAEADRSFYIPGDGEMKLQFFHVKDLCRLMETIMEKAPKDHILNVGNEESLTIREWVTLCYRVLGKTPEFVSVDSSMEQRNYFSFYRYEYALDVKKQTALLPETTPMEEGLAESWDWYQDHKDEVKRKPFFEFIEQYLK